MADEIIDVKLALDIATNILVTTAQFGQPNPTVIGPFIASDLMYSFAIKQYIDDNFGGEDGGLADEFSRDIFFKTFMTGLTVWITQVFTGEGVGIVDASLNAAVSYTASNGFQDILDLNK